MKALGTYFEFSGGKEYWIAQDHLQAKSTGTSFNHGGRSTFATHSWLAQQFALHRRHILGINKTRTLHLSSPKCCSVVGPPNVPRFPRNQLHSCALTSKHSTFAHLGYNGVWRLF